MLKIIINGNTNINLGSTSKSVVIDITLEVKAKLSGRVQSGWFWLLCRVSNYLNCH